MTVLVRELGEVVGVARACTALALSRVTTGRGPRRLTPSDRVYLKESNHLLTTEVAAIAYLRTADDYSEVHLTGGEVALVRRRLQAWEARLPTTFARIHRSTLINLPLVESLTQRDGRWEVRLRGVTQPLPVSRRLAPALKEQLEKLVP